MVSFLIGIQKIWNSWSSRERPGFCDHCLWNCLCEGFEVPPPLNLPSPETARRRRWHRQIQTVLHLMSLFQLKTNSVKEKVWANKLYIENHVSLISLRDWKSYIGDSIKVQVCTQKWWIACFNAIVYWAYYKFTIVALMLVARNRVYLRERERVGG